MNGIDKITQRIGADTQAEIDRILADAAAQAEAAADKFRTQAEAEDRDLLAKSGPRRSGRSALSAPPRWRPGRRF